MAQFNASMLKPASKSTEFNGDANKSPRATLAAAIDDQIAKSKDVAIPGKRWFVIGNTEAKLTLRYAGKSLAIAGEESAVVVPKEQLEAAYGYLKAEALKGTYDDALAFLETGRDARINKMRQTRQTKKDEKAAAAPQEQPAKSGDKPAKD
jgi:hypothetical protein